MVYLFDRPILPFYNKGKNLSFVVIIFISFFLIKRLRRFHFANLRRTRILSRGKVIFASFRRIMVGGTIPMVSLRCTPGYKPLAPLGHSTFQVVQRLSAA